MSRASTLPRHGGSLLLLALLPACGGGDGGGGTNPPPDGCAPALNAASGAPGTLLAVTGLPAMATAPEATLTAAGTTLPAVIRLEANGSLSLVVPVHPSGSVSGGAATLTVTANGTPCRPVNLTIAPLPEAPGAAEELVVSMEASLANAAAAYGVLPSELKGDTIGVPPTLRALQVAQRMIDHPDNPNSLRAIMAGTAPALGGRTLDADLLGRLMVSTGLSQAIDQHMAEIFNSLASQASDSSLVEIGDRPGAPAAARLASAVPIQPPRSIERGSQLAYWMKRQGEAQSRTSETMQQVVAGVELVLAAVAMTGPPGAVVAGAATVAVMTVYVTELTLKGTLPRDLTDLQVEAFPTDYPEDWALEGRWRARVTARSLGVSFSAATLAEEVAGLLGPGRFLKILEKFPGADDIVDEMWAKAVGSAAAALGMSGEGIQIAPTVWAGIDVSDQRYTRRELSSSGVVELSGTGVDWTYYRPVAPGQTTLTVTTFPATINSQLSRAVSLKVQQIGITVEAERMQMRPGTNQQLIVGVAGALDLGVNWTSTCGDVIKQPGAFATFVAPNANTTCTVTATHKIKTQRSGSIQIQVANVVTVDVTPAYPTLLRGEQKQFSATVEGTANTAVTWRASNGTITQQGLFTSPQDTGWVTITATSVADPGRSGFARVHVAGRFVAYDVQPVDVPKTRGQDSHPIDLNNANQVLAGQYLWAGGSYTDLLPAFAATGRGIFEVHPAELNDRGEVVGSLAYYTGSCGDQFRLGFYWSPTQITLLDGGAGSNSGACGDTHAVHINNHGRYIAVYEVKTGYYSFQLMVREGTRRPGVPMCGSWGTGTNTQGAVVGMNDAGDYITWYQFPYTSTVYRNYCRDVSNDLMYAVERPDPLPDGFMPQRMLPAGDVLGTLGEGYGLWRSGGAVRPITLNLTGPYTLRAVNSRGDMIGSFGSGFMVVRAGLPYDLNQLVPEGWRVDNVVDLNDSGVILAQATHEGVVRTVLLKPVADPAGAPFRRARLSRTATGR